MHFVDWSILLAFLLFTIWDGWRKSGSQHSIEDYFLAGRSIPWWAAGISVMATQASAITFIGTTGQAYVEDMRFLQVYLGIPFAMVILSLTLVPYYRRMRNFSAYEVLEERFGKATRLTTSFLFLLSRGLALGFTIAAPSIVLSLLLGVKLDITILVVGLIATVYTMAGGIAGVISTDIRQMGILMFGLLFCFGWIFWSLPAEVSAGDALNVAGTLGKLNALDLSFDMGEKYNVWSGVLAGIFLMLSYFGCDQTQVQRYLSARSLKEAQGSLMMTAFAKVPMQFIILLLGVMLYVFYVFAPAPLSFRSTEVNLDELPDRPKIEALQAEHAQAHEARRIAALEMLHSADGQAGRSEFLRQDAKVVELRSREQQIMSASIDNPDDTNFIVPWFILHEMPGGWGIIGLIIAGIFAAALSSIDSTLNSLSTVTIVDWYRRLGDGKGSDAHYVRSSRVATVLWGLLATVSALLVSRSEGSIIELVNQVGSYFYGSILGVFVLLLWVRRANGFSALLGLACGMFTVFLGDSVFDNGAGVFLIDLPGLQLAASGLAWGAELPAGFSKSIEYLWLNPLGAGVVVVVGWLFGRRST